MIEYIETSRVINHQPSPMVETNDGKLKQWLGYIANFQDQPSRSTKPIECHQISLYSCLFNLMYYQFNLSFFHIAVKWLYGYGSFFSIFIPAINWGMYMNPFMFIHVHPIINPAIYPLVICYIASYWKWPSRNSWFAYST